MLILTYIVHKLLFAPQILLYSTPSLVVCNLCCLLQQPTMMTDVQKCQCHGCQSNLSELRICAAPSCGNFCCLQCLKDLYSKVPLHGILDLDELGEEMFGCMKKFHAEICKTYRVLDDQEIAWNQDGKMVMMT